LPWILPTSSEKLALAKAFWIIAMTISPGARKSAKCTPMIVRPLPPSATVKIARYSKVVMAGAHTVCIWTLKNRRTSLI
jgi:hypothetical protein